MIKPKQAKKILPKAEYEQFESIIENQFSRMSGARLKQKATISRRLRDKYRDLARNQTVAAKRKLTNETDVSQNETRAEIFNELIERIEMELERPNRPEQRPTRTATKKSQSLSERRLARELADAKRR